MHRLTLIVLFTAAQAAAGDLTVDKAVQAALERPSSADARVEIAQARVALLQEMSKRRLEFRPQISLFSLTNPLSLIGGLGAVGGSSQVPPATLIDAEIDLMEAQAAKGRWQFQQEADATRQYYDLWDRQRSAVLSCGVADKAAAQREALNRRLAAGEITRLVVLRAQRALLDAESDCRRTQREVEVAGIKLARVVGGGEGRLRAVDYQPEDAEARHKLRPAAYLVKVALAHRSEPAGLRERIAALRAKIENLREPRRFQVSLFASNSGVGLPALTGIQPGFSLSMPLARNGGFPLEKHLLLLKLQAVEDDVDSLEQDIQSQMAEMGAWYEARREESDAAVERAALAKECRQALEARSRAGLEGPEQLAAAVDEERLASLEMVRLQTHSRAAFSALLRISGLGAQTGKAASELFADD